MFNILVYVNLVFNILFSLFLVVVLTGVFNRKSKEFKQIAENKKSNKTQQDYRRKECKK